MEVRLVGLFMAVIGALLWWKPQLEWLQQQRPLGMPVTKGMARFVAALWICIGLIALVRGGVNG